MADDEGENGEDKDADLGSGEDLGSSRVDPLLPEKQAILVLCPSEDFQPQSIIVASVLESSLTNASPQKTSCGPAAFLAVPPFL